MTKRKKIIITVISVVTAVVLAVLAGLYFTLLHRYKGKDINYIWHETDVFDIKNIPTVQKKDGKDFVILNLADVQMCDLEDIFHMPTIKREIDYLVGAAKPDLITLTGDQTWSNENLISLTSLVRWLDGYKIPYAPVFGNHDYGNDGDNAVLSERACCDVYESGKYSLFKRGPTNIGTLGNYAVNVMDGNKILRTLYMLDSGYTDVISDEQIAWFKWNAEGIKNANGGEYPQAMCFFHKPIPEFSMAYRDYYRGEREAEGEVYVTYSLFGSMQNGFFDVARERNVTDIVCGHQHGNSFTLGYKGVNLTFALKTGELGGYYEDEEVYLNGASYFTLSADTTVSSRLFVDREEFHI